MFNRPTPLSVRHQPPHIPFSPPPSPTPFGFCSGVERRKTGRDGTGRDGTGWDGIGQNRPGQLDPGTTMPAQLSPGNNRRRRARQASASFAQASSFFSGWPVQRWRRRWCGLCPQGAHRALFFGATCRRACCMADGVRAAGAGGAVGRWTGQDGATPLGGLRACVRA